MQVIAHSSTHAPSSASSRHCCGGQLRSREVFGRVRERAPCRVRAKSRRRPRSARPRSRVRSRGSRRGRATSASTSWVSGSSSPSASVDDDARTGDAELRGDAVLEVLAAARASAATRCRAPSPSATSTAAGFMPPTSRSQQMPPNTEIASPTSRCTAHASERGGGVVRLQHDGPVPGRGRFARGFERVDRSFTVRIGAEVAVQIGGTGRGRRSSAASVGSPRCRI